MRLTEKYRPRTLTELIGQEKAVKTCQQLTKNGLGGRAILLTGQSGQGKTSLARILANTFAQPQQGQEAFVIREVNGGEITINLLKEIRHLWTYCPLGGEGHVLIVNEFHALSNPVIEFLLDFLENLRSHCLVVLTSIEDAQGDFFDCHVDAKAFASRCIRIKLSERDLCDKFAVRAKEIAGIEGLDGKPLNDYKTLLKQCRNNFREALNQIETGAMLA